MNELKVRRVGNSLGVILPREVVNRLRATEGQRLYLVRDTRQQLSTDPVRPGVLKRKWPKPKTLSAATAIRYTRWLNERAGLDRLPRRSRVA